MVFISFNCNNVNKTNKMRSLPTEQDRKEFVIRRPINKSVLLQRLERSLSMSSSSSGSAMSASLASLMSESVMTRRRAGRGGGREGLLDTWRFQPRPQDLLHEKR